MEDSMDMESMAPLRPQNFLFGCELKADKKEYTFKVDDDENEHQLSLRTVSLGTTKDELHVIEAEGMNYEGKPLKIVLASLKPSVQPTVCLGGFEITPPVVLRLKSGSGPVYVSGQHLVALEDLGSSDEEEEDEEEDEEEEITETVKNAKRPAALMSKVPQKKAKLAKEEDDDDEDDDDDDDDEDDDDEEDDEDEEEETNVLPSPVAKSKPQKSKHNGKAEPSTPAKPPKTPEEKGKREAKPQTPKAPLTVTEIKSRMQATLDKGSPLPKVEVKFANYVKNSFRIDNKKAIDELWNWRKTLKDTK